MTAVLLLLCQIAPVSAQPAAQDEGMRVTQNKAILTGANKAAFTFQLASPAVIDQLSVIYGVSGHGCNSEERRASISITPGTQVQAQWAWNLAEDGVVLSGLEIWWKLEVHDQSGKTLTTDPQTLLFMDARYAWKKLEAGSLHLYWYDGSQTFGQRLMDIATQSLKKLADEAGVKSTGQIRIVVYPSAEDMRHAMPYIQEWAGGVALGERDLIVAGINPVQDITWVEELLPHELTHLITENGFINCEAVRLPLWLVEGIAKYTEGRVSPDDQNLVNRWLQADALPALKSMRYNFPADDAGASLAYAQSAMVVTYMIETHGAAKMNLLVENIRTGQTIDQALRTIYGLTTDELDQTWRAEMGYGAAPEAQFITETPEPSRTPYATFALKAATWSAVSPPTATPTATLAVATYTPSATPPASLTPIPRLKATSTPVASAAPTQAATTPWLLLAGGMLIAIGLVVGVGIWVIKK